MSMDLSVIGIVFAIILFIIFFAAVVLYLSFRIKETFREEKKRGFLVVKVAFLIGILFLAGGSFYFFAQILSPSSPNPVTQPENSTDVTPSPEPENPIDNSTSPEPIPEPEPEPPINDTPSPNDTTTDGRPELSLIISYPSRIKMNTEITMTFSITNPTEYIAHDVVIQTSILFEYFNLVSSTHKVTGNAIEISDISPGTTICSLSLVASNRPGEMRETIILIFNEMTEQISQEVSISVTGGPL